MYSINLFLILSNNIKYKRYNKHNYQMRAELMIKKNFMIVDTLAFDSRKIDLYSCISNCVVSSSHIDCGVGSLSNIYGSHIV